jgi:tubby-related protein 1
MHLSDGNKFLLSAKKRAANKTSNYLISTDPDNMNKNSTTYLGKLRSNFLGTEFYIFNEGANPKKGA